MKALRAVMLVALLVSFAGTAGAEVKLPAIFSDHLVLQRGTSVPVWGWAAPGESVKVTVDGVSASGTADKDGRWLVNLPSLPMSAAAVTMTVAGSGQPITVNDVLVGDVWVCSGQSNMQWGLSNAHNAKEEIPKADYPTIRFFKVPTTTALEPQSDCKAAWIVCSPATAGGFSAVGYFFGKEIALTQKVPVGLIGSYVGGTPAQAWTSLGGLDSDPALKAAYGDKAREFAATLPDIKAKHDAWLAAGGADYLEAVRRWNLANWQARQKGEQPPPRPQPPATPEPPKPGGTGTPTVLYNGMIAPLIPYAIKGVAWYQGESNAGQGLYRKLFVTMTADWRRQWGQGDFPFLYVQLPNYRPRATDPNASTSWALAREAQFLGLKALPNMGMAVTIDAGDGAEDRRSARGIEDAGAGRRFAEGFRRRGERRQVRLGEGVHRGQGRRGRLERRSQGAGRGPLRVGREPGGQSLQQRGPAGLALPHRCAGRAVNEERRGGAMKPVMMAALIVFGLTATAMTASAQAGSSILPARDPAPEGPAVAFLPQVAGKHPRLLIAAERVPGIVSFFNSDAGKLYRDQITAYVPGCTVPADRRTSAAWGQQYGLFRLPTVALHYVLTKDKASFDKSVAYLKWLAGQADWTRGGDQAVEDTPEAYAKVLETMKQLGPQGERNSDTTASFTMVGAALTFDWLYNDLDPAFREQFRKILWQHARAMYHGGHLAKNPGGGYWRGVPAYNHRWFRDWGMTLAALAAAEGKPEEQWLLGKIRDELQFMADWLPSDGSQHEGPAYGSSAGALGMTFQASDECLGTKHLEHPFFKSVGSYAMQMSAPGLQEAIYFADCGTRALSIHPFFLKTAADNRQADVLDGIRQATRINANRWGVRDYAWFSLLCDTPAVTGGSYAKLPTAAFLPDLGIGVMRDSWKDDAVAARFKCGPPGGYKLNAWREMRRATTGTLPYINVAHDHPDANSFVILGRGQYLAETDRYPLNPGKLSTGHNTILINGYGQVPQGRPDGDEWWQPGSGDMTNMGRITAWKDAGDVVVIEGEASGSYLAGPERRSGKNRPALERFRRTFIWVKGGYLLVLDDIRAPQPVDITWLVQGGRLETLDEAQGRYRLSKGEASCDFQLVADAPFTAKMGVSTANDHNRLLNWQQLQATAQAATLRWAAVFDPWGRKDLKVVLAPAGKDKATVTVTGAGISDTWQWQAATGAFESSGLRGARPGGFDVTVDAKSAAPPAPL